MQLRKMIPAVVMAAGLGSAVAGCHSGGGTGSTSLPSVNASESAAAHAAASALAAKCIPASPVAQIELVTSLKTTAGRVAFEATCGIPPAHKAAFEADLLGAAEAGHLTTKTGRTTFFSVTLPKIVEENQG